MRIGVISDTHKDIASARSVIKAMGKIELLLHAGDYYQDAQILAKEFNVNLKAVIGNCDGYNPNYPEEELFDIDDCKIYLTHGHKYRVKGGLQNLYYRGMELQANIIIFGHTHIPIYIIEGGIHILNPGSTAIPRGISNRPCGATIDIGQEILIDLKEF